MRVFAIGDLHLPGGQQKPMDVFGPHWEGHFEKISDDWLTRVTDDDIVLLPGDLSWAMKLQDAVPDLDSIGILPGRKIILRGNHDLWWNSLTKVKQVLPESIYALQNTCFLFENIAFCGSRGWTIPQPGDAENEKIFNREVLRMKLSLDQAASSGAERVIVLCHFPPVNENGDMNAYIRTILDCKNVTDIVYGHLHGPSIKNAFEQPIEGVRLHCVSCDRLNFVLKEIP